MDIWEQLGGSPIHYRQVLGRLLPNDVKKQKRLIYDYYHFSLFYLYFLNLHTPQIISLLMHVSATLETGFEKPDLQIIFSRKKCRLLGEYGVGSARTDFVSAFFHCSLGAQYPAQETDNTNTEKDSGAINFSILKSSVYLSQVKMKVKDKTDNCFL